MAPSIADVTRPRVRGSACLHCKTDKYERFGVSIEIGHGRTFTGAEDTSSASPLPSASVERPRRTMVVRSPRWEVRGDRTRFRLRTPSAKVASSVRCESSVCREIFQRRHGVSPRVEDATQMCAEDHPYFGTGGKPGEGRWPPRQTERWSNRDVHDRGGEAFADAACVAETKVDICGQEHTVGIPEQSRRRFRCPVHELDRPSELNSLRNGARNRRSDGHIGPAKDRRSTKWFSKPQHGSSSGEGRREPRRWMPWSRRRPRAGPLTPWHLGHRLASRSSTTAARSHSADDTTAPSATLRHRGGAFPIRSREVPLTSILRSIG